MAYTFEQYKEEMDKLNDPETMGEATLNIATMIKADKEEESELSAKLMETTTSLSDTQAKLLNSQKQLFILGVGDDGDNKPPVDEPTAPTPQELVNMMFGKESK